jgi:hypothetical protein
VKSLMRRWAVRRWAVAATAAVFSGGLMGVPTGVVSNSFYHRMTPVLWWNYPIWLASAVLIGLTAATYVDRGASSAPLAGGLFTTFAIGCPICNKLVVSAIGVSGALGVWAPVQPWLGVGSLMMLGWALHRRLRNEDECRLPARRSRSVSGSGEPGAHAGMAEPTAGAMTLADVPAAGAPLPSA